MNLPKFRRSGNNEHAIVEFDLAIPGDVVHVVVEPPLSSQWWSVTPDMALSITGERSYPHGDTIVAATIQLLPSSVHEI